MSMMTASSSRAGAVDVGEGGLHLPHAVDLGVDLLVRTARAGSARPAGRRSRAPGPRDAPRPPRRRRPDRPPRRTVMSMSGASMASTSLLGEGLGVVLGQGVVQRLLAPDLGAQPALEHLAGRLAGPEAGDADLAGDLAEGVVDRLVELVLVDLDGELDLVSLEGRDGGLHRGVSVTARCGTPVLPPVAAPAQPPSEAVGARPATVQNRRTASHPNAGIGLRAAVGCGHIHSGRLSGPGGYADRRSTGSGAVEAHLLWVQEVGGSNPPSPTSLTRDDTICR